MARTSIETSPISQTPDMNEEKGLEKSSVDIGIEPELDRRITRKFDKHVVSRLSRQLLALFVSY